MKQIVLVIMLMISLLIMPFVSADVPAVAPLKVQFGISVPVVVYDVPFGLTISANTGDLALIQYDLKISSKDKAVFFDKSYPYGIAGGLSSQSETGVKDSGKAYVLSYTVPNAEAKFVSSQMTPFSNIAQTRIIGKDTIAVFNLDATYLNKFVPLATDAGNFEIKLEGDGTFKPIIADCGDGVVGYVDADKNGQKDLTDVEEKCDTSYFDVQGKKQPNAGCMDCKYIQKEYRVMGFKTLGEKQSCDFGSYSCSLEALPARDLFLAKVGALLDGKCFPYNEHKDADYCEGGKPMLVLTPDGKIKSEDRVSVIVHIGSALTELLGKIIS